MLGRPVNLGLPKSPAELQGPQDISPHPSVTLDLSSGPPAEVGQPTGMTIVQEPLHALLL